MFYKLNILVFLCYLGCFIKAKAIMLPMNNEGKNANKIQSLNKAGDEEQYLNYISSKPRFDSNERSEMCSDCPIFPKPVQFFYSLQSIKDGKPKIKIPMDGPTEVEMLNPLENYERNIKSKSGNNILTYLLNTNYDILTNCQNYEKLTNNENDKTNGTNEESKITLMQLENENRDSMSKQFKENQRKSRPYIIIHSHKVFPSPSNQIFFKNSTNPQQETNFCKDLIKKSYPTIKQNEFESIISVVKNGRKRKRSLDPKEGKKTILGYENVELNNITDNKKLKTNKRSSRNKHLIKEFDFLEMPIFNKFKRSQEKLSMKNNDFNQNPSMNINKIENILRPHKRCKHQENLKNLESEYFSSYFTSTHRRRNNHKNKLNGNRTFSKQRNKFLKNEEKLRTKNRFVKKHSSTENKIIKRYCSQKDHNRFKKDIYFSMNDNSPELSRNNSRYSNIFKQKRDILTTNVNENSCTESINKKYNCADNNLNLKLKNNKNEMMSGLESTELSMVGNSRTYGSYQNSGLQDLNIVDELTPVYPIAKERTCTTTRHTSDIFTTTKATTRRKGCSIFLTTKSCPT